MKNRNVIAVVCFSIITLGIYDLFWLVSTKKELNARTKQHIPSIWLLFIPVLALIILIGIDAAVAVAQSNSGSGSSAASIIVGILVGLVSIFAAVVIPVYWFLKYSKAVHEYTNGELSTAVSFLLLWVLRFVGIAVIQDKFNDMLAASSAAGAMPMAAGMAVPVPPQMPGVTSTPPMPPINPAVAPTSNQQQPVMPQVPQDPAIQSPVQQPQQPVDPTRPESYDQQQQIPPAPQPPVPPAGPVVQ
jgi:hypothetical protein